MGSLHWFGRVHTWVTYIHTYIALPPPSPRQVIHVPVALDETKYEGSYLYISPHDNITQMLLVMVNNKARKGMGFFSLPGYFCLHKFIWIFNWVANKTHIFRSIWETTPLPFLSYRILFVRDFFPLSFFSLRETDRNGNKISPANFIISPLFSVLAIAGPLA